MENLKTEERVCINCGCELEDGEGIEYGIVEICAHCLENEFHRCDNCGRLNERNGLEVGDAQGNKYRIPFSSDFYLWTAYPYKQKCFW